MPTDYVQIREENIRRYGTETAHLALLGDLYSDRTHFIFELLQNAEDAKASEVHFHLGASGLELSHDGRPFTSDDVRGISSVCQSTSRGDPERIGRFGIGFKSVYAYTRHPEVHSGDEHFCIDHYVRPLKAAPRTPGDGLTTLIALPFDGSAVAPALAKQEITRAFERLDPTTLLFLRRVKRVELSADGVVAVVLERRRTDQISPWVRLVELDSSRNGAAQEKWLLFERAVKLSTPIGRDVETRVELAFELTPASSKDAFEIVARERAVLAVFFPTEWKTATGFILQGPYVPTPARDNIRQNDPTNSLLARESAELVVDSLCWLRERGALTPGVLNTLPLKRSDFPEDTLLRPLFDRVLEAILGQALLPAHTAEPKPKIFVEGRKAVAASSASLRDLLGDGLLAELAGDQSCKWLADGLTVKGTSDLAKYLREEVGVREISARGFVAWLGTKDAAWWKGLDEAWLAECYRYLHTQTAEHPALKKLPIVRLESGEHVVPADEAVFFPTENAHEKEELAPFLTQLPIVRQSLLNDDKDKSVESFLRQMGVAPLVAFQFIQKYLVPRYASPKDVTLAENRSHVRFLRRAFSRMSPDELKTAISDLQGVRFLICHKASDPEPNYLVSPTIAYVPSTYTNDNKLELFFKASPNTWFVDRGYISEGEETKRWNSFLTQLGAAELPRVTDTEEYHRKDLEVDGLKAALDAVAKVPAKTRTALAHAIWSVVCQLLPGDGDFSEYGWERFIHGQQAVYGPRGGYHGSREIDASFFVALRDTMWLPDEAGEPHKPGQLFEDTKFNREMLGETVLYLHRDISLKTRKDEWLAGKLGIRRAPTKEGVLGRLRSLKVATATTDQALPLYEFLDRTRADVSEVFEQESLILYPGPEPRWIKPSQSFWEDESAVFGSTRGYLRKHYPALREFFSRIRVVANAGPTDYARALLEIAAAGLTEESTRIRVHRIYKRLADRLEEGGDWQKEEDWKAIWKRLLQGDHWLGRCADAHTFEALKQLVRIDNEHLAALFEGRLSFWPFPDLNDFASEQLSVVGCSSASCRFTPVEPGGADERLSQQLNKHWPLICAFLHSEKWKSAVRENAETALARKPVVNQATRIAVTYELAGVTVEEPEGKSSFFDGESGTLWLAKGLDEDDAAEAMGDALQEHFGPEVLREFVCDLFRKAIAKALEKWRKKGLILTAPVEPAPEDLEVVPADDSEQVQPRVEESESPVGDVEAADSSGGRVAGDAEPTTQQPTSGRDGDPSSATGKDTGEATASSDGQPPRKSDPKTGPAAPASGMQGEETTDLEEETSETGREAANPGVTGDVKQALKDAFNKAGQTQITDDRPESDSVRDPEERRKKTRANYQERRRKEPKREQRVTRRTVDVWDPKNKMVRDFLYEEYGGRCQVCGDLNRFPKSDGRAYFEALYLVPHAQMSWTDEPGSVVCLCALCSAKFQFGAVECEDIVSQINSQKTLAEGGIAKPVIRLKLIGKSVTLTFSERHMIEVQELLAVATPDHATQGELIRCPHCVSEVRVDRLQSHINRVHGKAPQVRQVGVQRTRDGGYRRCRHCSREAAPNSVLCYNCIARA